MKNSKLGLLVAAALVGLTQVAQAKLTDTVAEKKGFIPLEKLDPQTRALFLEQIQILQQSVQMDWNSVVFGINQNGELTIKERKSYEPKVAAPSTWTN